MRLAPERQGVDGASMGPRSHERGNAAAILGTKGAADMLQWGRVLMNAETPRVYPYALRCGCRFNGAAFS